MTLYIEKLLTSNKNSLVFMGRNLKNTQNGYCVKKKM